jgi:nitrate reductase gamma subunit
MNFTRIVELPLDIHNPHATYETQFGYLQRPAHKNTTWDIAKVRTVHRHSLPYCSTVFHASSKSVAIRFVLSVLPLKPNLMISSTLT